MKNYRIREGSIAWYVKKYGRLMAVVLLLGVISLAVIDARGEEIAPQSENNLKVEEAYAMEEKELVNEITGFAPLDIPLHPELQEFIFGVAEDYGLEGELVTAVIGIESNYKANSVGDNGDAYGLMQVQPKWYEAEMERLKISKEELLDPYANVVVGVDVLAGYVERFGVEYGLVAYNAGPDDAIAMKEQGTITEYAESVIMLADLLKQ